MNSLDDILQLCLEEMESGRATAVECLHRYPDVAEELAPLLLAADRLRGAPRVRPSVAFSTSARARMLNLMATSPAPAKVGHGWTALLFPRLWQGNGLAPRLARLGVAAAVLLAGVGGGGLAASAAPPDSPLYPAKLAIEDLRVMVAQSEQERTEVRLAIVDRRATELVEMAARGATDDLSRVVERYETAVQAAVAEATRSGPDSPAAATLEEHLDRQEERLQDVSTRMDSTSAESQASLERALGFLERQRTELRSRMASGPPADAEHPEEREDRNRRGRRPTSAGAKTPDAPEDPNGPTLAPSPSSRAANGTRPTSTAVSPTGQPTTTGVEAAVPAAGTSTPTTATTLPTVQRGDATPTATSGSTATPKATDEERRREPTLTPTPTPTSAKATSTPTARRAGGSPMPTATPTPTPTPGPDGNPPTEPTPGPKGDDKR